MKIEAKIPSYVKENETIKILTQADRFDGKNPVWTRIEVDYSNPNENKQHVFVIPMTLNESNYESSFTVPTGAARLMVSYCDQNKIYMDSLHTRVTDSNGKLKRRASFPYLFLDGDLVEELNKELESYPDSYEAYHYLWQVTMLTKGNEEYLNQINKDMPTLRSGKRNAEWYVSYIEGLLALQKFNDAYTELKIFAKKHPTSWLYFKSFEIFEKAIASDPRIVDNKDVLYFSMKHLLQVANNDQAFDYAYLLPINTILKAELKNFEETQIKVLRDKASPILYSELRKTATRNAWHAEALEYSQKALKIIESEKDLPNFYFDKTMGKIFQGTFFSEEKFALYQNYFNNKKYQELIDLVNKKAKTDETYIPIGELYALKGRAYFALKQYSEAEKSLLDAYVSGTENVKNEVKEIYRIQTSNTNDDEFERVFKVKLKKHAAK